MDMNNTTQSGHLIDKITRFAINNMYNYDFLSIVFVSLISRGQSVIFRIDDNDFDLKITEANAESIKGSYTLGSKFEIIVQLRPDSPYFINMLEGNIIEIPTENNTDSDTYYSDLCLFYADLCDIDLFHESLFDEKINNCINSYSFEDLCNKLYRLSKYYQVVVLLKGENEPIDFMDLFGFVRIDKTDIEGIYINTCKNTPEYMRFIENIETGLYIPREDAIFNGTVKRERSSFFLSLFSNKYTLFMGQGVKIEDLGDNFYNHISENGEEVPRCESRLYHFFWSTEQSLFLKQTIFKVLSF